MEAAAVDPEPEEALTNAPAAPDLAALTNAGTVSACATTALTRPLSLLRGAELASPAQWAAAFTAQIAEWGEIFGEIPSDHKKRKDALGGALKMKKAAKQLEAIAAAGGEAAAEGGEGGEGDAAEARTAQLMTCQTALQDCAHGLLDLSYPTEESLSDANFADRAAVELAMRRLDLLIAWIGALLGAFDSCVFFQTMAARLALIFMSVRGTAAHGRITFPPSRQGGTFEVAGTTCGNHDGGTQIDDGCGWLTNGVEIPGKPTLIDPDLLTTADSIADPLDHQGVATRPWRSPGNAPMSSPCGNNIYHSELDGLDLPPNAVQTIWRQGEVVTVASSLYINHGGGWSWRLCPKSASITEACFQENVLDFADATQTLRFTDGHDVVIPARHTQDGKWARNPVPAALEDRHRTVDNGTHVLQSPFAVDAFEFPMPVEGLIPSQWDFSVVESVIIPETTAPGEYLLSWRWDCELSRQVWLNCADITVAGAEEAVVV